MITKELKFSPLFVLKAIKQIIENPELLLCIDAYRVAFANERIEMAKAENEGKLNVSSHDDMSNDAIIENTFRHNLESLNPSIAFMRPIGLLGPILGMDQVLNYKSSLKVLIVGPRTEAEILWYIAQGFNKENIVGLDLFTYSEFIVTGDMHKMPFKDNEFDIVNFSWVLGYSKNQKIAIEEAIRIVKPYGLIGIGEQWDPTPTSETTKIMKETRGYALEGIETHSANDLIELFEGSNYKIVFQTEPIPSQKDRIGLISIIAQIAK